MDYRDYVLQEWQDNMSVEANSAIFKNQFYYYLLTKFKWNNLPPEINPIFLEKYLILYGTVGFTKLNGVYYALPAQPDTMYLNVYGEPQNYNLIQFNMQQSTQPFRRLPIYDGLSTYIQDNTMVLIKNNTNKEPSQLLINYYSAHMAQVRTITDYNTKLLAKPYIVEADERNIKGVLEKIADILTLKPFIVKVKGKDPTKTENIKVHNLNINAEIDNLLKLFTFLKSEFLTELGINNVGTEKKERLITDEVNANNQEIYTGLPQNMFEERQRACELINKAFGLNVSVELNVPEGSETYEVQGEWENSGYEDDTDNAE